MEPKNELQRNAIAEARRKELESYQRALDIQWLNSRMEDGRTGRCLALIEREAEMEKDFQERTDHAAIVNARAEQEAKLGSEIAKVQSEEVTKLMRRQYLRERDPSLRTLEKKLQAGYVCRDQQQQILHNEYKRLQDKVEESRANRVLLNALYNDAETAEREDKAKMEKNLEYTKELQQQLVNRQRQKQCQYEDTLIEKKMLEDITRTLADEDQREIQYKKEQTEKMRNEMETFQQARDAWKEKQKKMVINEERDIEAQIRAAGDRSAAIVAERERKMHLREQQTQIIGEKLLAETAERQKREDIIKMLQEQEYLEKNAQDDIAEREKMERYRAETKESLTTQLRSRERAARQVALQEAAFRKEAEKQMALEDERESEKERKKKERNHQYFEDLKAQIADNAVRRKAEHDLEERRAKTQFDHDEAWLAEVAEERKKIVEEHAPPLIGYLQAGVIKHDDLPVVRRGADNREDLATLDIESMAISNRPHRFAKCNDQCKAERLEDEIEREEERKKEERNHQHFEDLKQQIEGNAIRRKADHDLEERRAKTEFDQDAAWLAEEAEERKHIVEDHAPPLIGYESPIGRKGVDSRYTTHHTNFQTERQMVIEDERESEQERKKDEKDHQYFEDLKQQIAGNVVRRKAEHDVEVRRAKTEFGGEFDDESWLAKEAEERKHIVGYSQAGVVKHDDLPVERKGAGDREDFSDRPHRFANRNDQREAERQMALEDERESEEERKKEERDHQYFEDLKAQIADNAVRRKAEHDLEERRAKTELDQDEARLAEEAEERKQDDLSVGRKGAEMRDGLATLDVGSMAISNRPYRFAKSNDQYEAERQMALEDEKESEEERKKEERDHQYFEDLKQQIAGNAIRRKAEHDLEERRAKTEFDQDEAWLAEEAEERKNIVE